MQQKTTTKRALCTSFHLLFSPRVFWSIAGRTAEGPGSCQFLARHRGPHHRSLFFLLANDAATGGGEREAGQSSHLLSVRPMMMVARQMGPEKTTGEGVAGFVLLLRWFCRQRFVSCLPDHPGGDNGNARRGPEGLAALNKSMANHGDPAWSQASIFSLCSARRSTPSTGPCSGAYRSSSGLTDPQSMLLWRGRCSRQCRLPVFVEVVMSISLFCWKRHADSSTESPALPLRPPAHRSC